MTERTAECEHKYVFLKSFDREKSWHHWVRVDEFFCEKCLEYKQVEREREEARRW